MTPMTSQITISREGRNGFPHEIVMEVGFDNVGRFSSKPISDVRVRVRSTRFDPEGDWIETHEVEFSSRHQIKLSDSEFSEALTAIRREERACNTMLKQFREKMAA